MGRPASPKPKSGPASERTGRVPRSTTPLGLGVAPEARIADLETQLALAIQSLQNQRSSYDEDSASFEKTLARLAQSERSLSQTKARLVDAEASASAAEAREQQALATARAARFEQAANAAELEELQGKVSDLQAEHALLGVRHAEVIAERASCEVDLAEAVAVNEGLKRDLDDCQAELAAAKERNGLLTHERTRLSSILASLEVLAREITHLTVQSTTAGASLPAVEGWLGRDVEAEHIRATVRPEGCLLYTSPSPRD